MTLWNERIFMFSLLRNKQIFILTTVFGLVFAQTAEKMWICQAVNCKKKINAVFAIRPRARFTCVVPAKIKYENEQRQ